MCRTTALFIAICAGLVAAGVANGSPTALNIIPTADVLERGSYTLQLESNGHPTAISDGSSLLALTQFGLAGDIEVGLDVYDLHRQAQWLLNGKWQFAAETARRPAMAVGVYNVAAPDADTAYYLALSKYVGGEETRLTVGGERSDRWRGAIGFDHYFGDRFGLLVDWTTGPEAYATVGLTCELTPGLWLSPYYAWNNSSSGEDFMGLNLYWQGAWR